MSAVVPSNSNRTTLMYVAILIRIQSSAHPVLKRIGIPVMFLVVSHPQCRGLSASAMRMIG